MVLAYLPTYSVHEKIQVGETEVHIEKKISRRKYLVILMIPTKFLFISQFYRNK